MVDVEILNRLKALLSLNVYMEVPDDAPEEFYVIQFVKGECRHGLAEMSIIAQSYGNTMYRACDMNKDMQGHGSRPGIPYFRRLYKGYQQEWIISV